MRCLHIDSGGRSCSLAPIEGAEFCEAHFPLPASEEPTELSFAHRLLRRSAAALLLALFLLQFYATMKFLLGD